MEENKDIGEKLLINFNPKPKIFIIEKETHPKIIIKNSFNDGREIRRSNRERVTEHRLVDRTIKFHEQLNGYDCGPCLVLNVLEIFKNKSGTVENIRQQINSCNDKEYQYKDK